MKVEEHTETGGSDVEEDVTIAEFHELLSSFGIRRSFASQLAMPISDQAAAWSALDEFLNDPNPPNLDDPSMRCRWNSANYSDLEVVNCVKEEKFQDMILMPLTPATPVKMGSRSTTPDENSDDEFPPPLDLYNSYIVIPRPHDDDVQSNYGDPPELQRQDLIPTPIHSTVPPQMALASTSTSRLGRRYRYSKNLSRLGPRVRNVKRPKGGEGHNKGTAEYRQKLRKGTRLQCEIFRGKMM